MEKKQSYVDQLRESYAHTRSLVCMGLDPIVEYLPVRTDSVRADLNTFFRTIFKEMNLLGVYPGAFKPNIGYYSALDRPLEEDFTGSLALADLIEMLENFFPGVPVILDSKRGDIARSSLNYAIEAFDGWQADAVTVSPYMGTDSVSPFMVEGKGIYILNRTSNPGGKDLQNLISGDEDLYLKVADTIIGWSRIHEGIGAVVGATSPDELEMVAARYASSGSPVPLLIPGVGSQGGSASEVVTRLKKAGYELPLARINSSSGITHPWKGGDIPEDWADVVLENLRKLNDEIEEALA